MYMAVRDYIITVYAEEHGVQDGQYPLMSISFNDTLIENSIEVKKENRNTYTQYSKSLLPEWTKVKYAREDTVGFFNYKFIVSLNDNSDNNLITEHSIKFKFTNPNLTCSINLKKVELNEIVLTYPEVLNNENLEYELKFKMPIYPHKKEVKFVKGTKWKVEYLNVFSTPISIRYFINHKCKETLIEMIRDYYKFKESNKYGQSDEKILLNSNLKPLWISFQNAFDDHCKKFNLPKVIIRASWFIWYSGSDSIQSHTHPATSLIGTYYPHVDEGSSPVIFEHPSNDVMATNNIRRMGYDTIHTGDLNTDYSIEEGYIEPMSEMFSIFPSYVRHCVRPNQIQHRYILVANTVLYSERELFGLKDLRPGR